MAAAMPELGSKISLISKADIRYEGRLFTVDPQECTIALASVRSFGTEDRDTQYPVPAQSQVYDYILFRGSDIKDIRIVVNNPAQPLNDPAIMQVSVPPSLGAPQFQQHPVLSHVGATPIGQFGAYGLGGINLGAGTSGLQANLGSIASSSKLNDLIGGHDDQSSRAQELINSRSTTPASVRSRKSSTDQGTQAGGNQRRDSEGSRKHVKPIQPPRGQNRTRSRERNDSQNRGDYHDNRQASPHNRRQQYQPNLNRQNNYPHQRGYHHQQPQGGYHNQQQQHGGYQNAQRGGWMNQRMPHPQRGRGRPHPRGGYMRPNQGGPQGNKKTLKFDSEYDFEQANTEFEELRSKLAKAKLDDAASTKSADGVANGVPEGDKKDDSGNETCAGDTEQEEDHEVFYDKAKSFFDKISCEAVERAKGKTQRTDWRVERKLNSETFGVASARRGFFRGRGNFRGGYRGNYRGGYRYPQQNRPGNNTQQQRNNEQENAAEPAAAQ